MNRIFFFILICLTAGCTMPEKRLDVEADSTSMSTLDSNYAITGRDSLPLPEQPSIKHPNGIYHTVLPGNGGTGQTVAFYRDFSYELQETYRKNGRDSVVVIKGNWSPSNGFIWLYKDQVVRARYTWKGDQLHYYSPALKKTFPMQAMEDIMNNRVWREKPKQGVVFFGIGNEPFWSIEVNNKDSLFFLLSEWSKPLRLRISSRLDTKDSLVYTAQNDSASVQLSVYPYFCSDGMSDYMYRNQIHVRYNQTVYRGCGIRFR